MKTQNAIHVRWMIARDLPEVLAIEESMGADAWGEEGLRSLLTQRNCIGMVADNVYTGKVFGYMVYMLEKGHLDCLRLVVDPALRNRGIGSAMLKELKRKVDKASKRDRITMGVWERDTQALLWLRSQGFSAERINRGQYGVDDGIEMTYQA